MALVVVVTTSFLRLIAIGIKRKKLLYQGRNYLISEAHCNVPSNGYNGA